MKPGDYIDGYAILTSMYEDLQKSRQIEAITHFTGKGIYVATVNDWYVPFNSLEFATAPEKIIIYRNGAEVVAKNTATGKTGVAKCNPADEFDFNIGAKLAFERLTNPEPVKPKYYSGKVVCIDDSGKGHIKGKIYRVIDGSLEFENSFPTLTKFHSLEEINKLFDSQFIELVE